MWRNATTCTKPSSAAKNAGSGCSLRYYAQRYGDGVVRELGRKGDKASRRIREETETLWGKTEKALEEVLGQ